ncbi:SDR family oxidoreductase [Dactylosporangium sp. NPDC000555]|uniref:SDR family NAD(P)-dependent oxidoreductase n=1 Tax=Dactylosporangium sp. NPDC000555 TaxID=3154260 RepID=UPI003322164A
MVNRLAKKVAIVTGGASGIGLETVRLYAEEGARVVAADFRDDEGTAEIDALRGQGLDCTYVHCDVTVRDEVVDLVRRTESLYGPLNIMTANAGINGRGRARLADVRDEDAEEIMRVNWLGVYYSFKFAIPSIRKAGRGALTATSSLAEHRGFPALPVYSASKAAVSGLARSLASDLFPQIRVNVVSSGRVETKMFEHTAELMGIARDEIPADWNSGTSGRAKPREIAYAHLFLASDEASFITGQTLMVDGGQGIMLPPPLTSTPSELL